MGRSLIFPRRSSVISSERAQHREASPGRGCPGRGDRIRATARMAGAEGREEKGARRLLETYSDKPVLSESYSGVFSGVSVRASPARRKVPIVRQKVPTAYLSFRQPVGRS